MKPPRLRHSPSFWNRCSKCENFIKGPTFVLRGTCEKYEVAVEADNRCDDLTRRQHGEHEK